MSSDNSERQREVQEEDKIDELPEHIYMLDISADKSCMAIIYKTTAITYDNAETGTGSYRLTLYNLPGDGNIEKHKRNTYFKEIDVSYIQSSNVQIYIFLSVSRRDGYVALSFIEMGETGGPANPSHMFSNCILYGNNGFKKEIPFQGRAVFLEDRLALVGFDTLVIYKYPKNGNLKKDYTLDTHVLSDGSEATKYQTEIIDDIPWAKYIPLPSKKTTPKAAHDIITMSQHIISNVLVTQKGLKDGNTVRIWSIFDGTLFASYKFQHIEHVMAISDNYRYIATYDNEDEVARIYCTKACTKLHTIPIITQSNTDSHILTISFMRFFGNGRYIIISGFMPDPENPNSHRLYRLEVWCISSQKLLFTRNQSVYWKLERPNEYRMLNLIPFIMESKNDLTIKCKWLSNNMSNTSRITKKSHQCNLPEIKAIFAPIVDRKIKIDTKTLFKQDWKEAIEEASKRWVTKGSDGKESGYKITFLNREILNVDNKHELNDSLDQYKNLFCCSIVTANNYFILRFGYFTVQLWRLRKLPLSVGELDRENIGFQFEKSEGQPYFYKYMEDSELVYIRAYKTNDYRFGFTFKEDCNIHLGGRVSKKNKPGDKWKKREPDVLFMEDIGHIFVQTELKYNHPKKKQNEPTDKNITEFINFFKKKTDSNELSSNNKQPKVSNRFIDIDEIFLPLSKFSTSNGSCSPANFAPDSAYLDFHEIESACRALHHINNKDEKTQNKPELYKENLSMMNDKIHRLILKLIDSNSNVKFFTTVSGSKALAMLASFPLGRNILKYIITRPRIPISIFNYTKDNYVQESVLTVLIEENKHDLFNAFFYRILTDSLEGGSEKLSAVAGSLLCLQRKRIPDLLLNCLKMLTYIPVRLDRHPILQSEYNDNFTKKIFQHDGVPYFRTLNSCCTLEQIDKYEDTFLGRFLFEYTKLKRSRYIRLIKAIPATFYWFLFGENIIERGKLCVVPLPGFNDYKIQLEEILYRDDEKKQIDKVNETQKLNRLNNTKKNKEMNGEDSDGEEVEVMPEKDAFEIIKYRSSSTFTCIASSSNENQVFKQPGTVMEIITQYKWKTYLRTRFFVILLLHAVYYISYSTTVSFPEELYNYKPGDGITNRKHFASTFIMFFSGFILLVLEMFQFQREKIVYLTSFFNWVDIAAFTLPIASFFLLLFNSEFLLDVGSITILVLWLHAILRLRVFSYFGKILETIIQILLKILPFICIMFLVVFAFTHTFMYRLRNLSDQFFQEEYQGGPSNADGDLLNGTQITLYDTSSQNDFSNPFKAFSIVWFFIYGVFDPVNSGNVGDDTMTIILIIIFSFVTILIFSNMVIALMSSTVDDVRRQGDIARLTHFSAVVGEIELLWFWTKDYKNRRKNPNYIYYIASESLVEKHCNKLRAENNRLIKELK